MNWNFFSYDLKHKIDSWKTNVNEGGGALSFYFSHVLYHGDLDDLIDSPILLAECSCSVLPDTDEYSFNTARFYKFATVKGYVTFRFTSSTSGAYSDAVQMFRAHKGV